MFARVALALVFVVAAAAKLRDIDVFRAYVADALPARWRSAAARSANIVLGAELALGVACVSLPSVAVLVAVTAFISMATVFLAVRLLYAPQPECNCFGASSSTTLAGYIYHIARDPMNAMWIVASARQALRNGAILALAAGGVVLNAHPGLIVGLAGIPLCGALVGQVISVRRLQRDLRAVPHGLVAHFTPMRRRLVSSEWHANRRIGPDELGVRPTWSLHSTDGAEALTTGVGA